MSGDGETIEYETAGTLFGALQRGLGRGAIRAATEAGAAEAVFRCVKRDQRWDTQVEDRTVYLARLVRDLELPLAPLLGLLGNPPGADGYGRDETFGNVLSVLTALGTAGNDEAVEGLRLYVAAGPRWAEVLEQVAEEWPRDWWDGLLTVARHRIPDAGDNIWWGGRPWTDWAAADEAVEARLAVWEAGYAAARAAPYRLGAGGIADAPAERLLAAIRADGGPWLSALMELNRRGPEPALLPLLDMLAERAESPGAQYAAVGKAVRLLGQRALPHARRWVAGPEHPLADQAVHVLADHGDVTDVPVLLAVWERLAREPEQHCGYDVVAEGLARIGGPTAGRVVPWLRERWVTPHSYERAAYLRALLALDPEGADPLLVEGLWDCEKAVRTIAAQRAGLTPVVRDQLAALRDDPIEEKAVRAIAAARLA
ncbi:hypothetical protein QLQ12_40290 [Actinoplanes sp. NEAU-A12]|uniref:HEAT repeat domain-containing protein n=1 Tax=Actinoplanes sandaracinus TaxID=3045177 RepID=A0ABT6WYL9_9ACTN|nr:hypothetical protein [Actinoplanes sandaracinus]MDI6104845.1 hypothetical protein [Actinoplanes sandaracinus]